MIGAVLFILFVAVFAAVFVGLYYELVRWDRNMPTHDSYKAQRDAVTARYLRSIGEDEMARKYDR